MKLGAESKEVLPSQRWSMAMNLEKINHCAMDAQGRHLKNKYLMRDCEPIMQLLRSIFPSASITLSSPPFTTDATWSVQRASPHMTLQQLISLSVTTNMNDHQTSGTSMTYMRHNSPNLQYSLKTLIHLNWHNPGCDGPDSLHLPRSIQFPFEDATFAQERSDTYCASRGVAHPGLNWLSLPDKTAVLENPDPFCPE